MSEKPSKPYYILSAQPSEASKIKDIFSSHNNNIVEMLRNPVGIRDRGWDLRTYDYPRIEQGEYWETSNVRKLIRLFEDGSFILRVLANQDFLGWGKWENEFIKNPIIHIWMILKVIENMQEMT
jgi:hypothetical protein